MDQTQQSYETLQDIKRMMERSSRFISLSGLSGIAAGAFALLGAWLAHPYVFGYKDFLIKPGAAFNGNIYDGYTSVFNNWLFWIAAGTLFAAFAGAFFFTWIRSKKEGIPIWGNTAKRLMVNVSIPLVAGAVFLFKLIEHGTFGARCTRLLNFYGLALINAGKYTVGEIRVLGCLQLLLGLISLWFVGLGLYFWAVGFGLLHIVYGVLMWLKYERTGPKD